MGRRGYSLIEMLVAICIASILTSFALLKVAGSMRRARAEEQTRVLRSELMGARLAAVTQQREVMVNFYRDRFERYSSAEPVKDPRRRYLEFPIRWAPSNKNPLSVVFDEKGVALKQEGSICLEEDDAAAVDSVVVAKTRIGLGKRGKGKGCLSDEIALQ